MEKRKIYCPSNGSEADGFISKFCSNCINEQFLHTQNDDHKICNILSNTMCFSRNDPEYPKEWTYNENDKPICTAFKKWEWQFDEHGEPMEDELPSKDPNQISLF